jgi:hypothetical protein
METYPMNIRYLRFLGIVLMVALAGVSATSTRNEAAQANCSKIIAKRNLLFDETRKNQSELSALRKQISSEEGALELLSGSGETFKETALKAKIGAEKVYLTGRQATQKHDEAALREIDAEIHACRQGGSSTKHPSTPRAKPFAPGFHWNGTYTEGPFTIEVSGGFGSLSFQTARHEPGLDNTSSGTCQAKGSEATCKWSAEYKDTAKTVQYSGHGTLHFYGNVIGYHFVEDAGSITLAEGQCADIKECTGLHPGAEFDGNWTRKP